MTPRRAFVVEDDAATARLLRAVLEKEGFAVRAHDRAEGAVVAAHETAPDVVLLDIGLPDGDGFELCAAMRADPALEKVPVIFLSALTDVESRLRSFAVGGHDFVPKPFAASELAARLHAQLRVREEARQTEDIRRSVADMVVHDLKAPLGAIKIALTILQERLCLTDPALAKALKAAEASADLAVLMVNDLLDLGEGRLRVAPAAADLDGLLGRVSDTVAPLARRWGTELTLSASPAGASVRTDPMLVYRVMTNLLVNAVKFSAWGKGTAALEARIDGAGGLAFTVSDQGPGIPDEEKESVFLKYFRGQSARSTAAPGSGIGLSFCKLAVDALGGSIKVVDNVPKGSRFVVELPPA